MLALACVSPLAERWLAPLARAREARGVMAGGQPATLWHSKRRAFCGCCAGLVGCFRAMGGGP